MFESQKDISANIQTNDIKSVHCQKSSNRMICPDVRDLQDKKKIIKVHFRGSMRKGVFLAVEQLTRAQ